MSLPKIENSVIVKCASDNHFRTVETHLVLHKYPWSWIILATMCFKLASSVALSLGLAMVWLGTVVENMLVSYSAWNLFTVSFRLSCCQFWGFETSIAERVGKSLIQCLRKFIWSLLLSTVHAPLFLKDDVDVQRLMSPEVEVTRNLQFNTVQGSIS